MSLHSCPVCRQNFRDNLAYRHGAECVNGVPDYVWYELWKTYVHWLDTPHGKFARWLAENRL